MERIWADERRGSGASHAAIVAPRCDTRYDGRTGRVVEKTLVVVRIVTMQIEVVIEIPKGTRNKYETDEQGNIWLDRTLFTSTHYPEEYGFVPDSLAEDGDPVDALVILDEPTFPGCHLRARPVGVFRMTDEEGVDAKVLCVLDSDKRWDRVQDIQDLSPYQLDEIAHFFKIYKDLEPGKEVLPGGWEGRSSAEKEVVAGLERYRAKHGAPS